MTADLELHTISACGSWIGGPGGWQLPGLQPADQLRTAWHDETDPTHQFAQRAGIHVKARLGLATPELSALPWTFATATEVSPDDWFPETSTPPPSSLRLARRYDRKASHFLGFLRLACALICYRRAVRLELLTSNNP